MKRKEYEKPKMRVYVLKHQPALLAGSVEATRSGYGDAEELNWD